MSWYSCYDSWYNVKTHCYAKVIDCVNKHLFEQIEDEIYYTVADNDENDPFDPSSYEGGKKQHILAHLEDYVEHTGEY